MELGALIQRVDTHDDKFDELEGRITRQLDSLTGKFDKFIVAYNQNQIMAAGQQGYAKGEGKTRARIESAAISAGSTGIMALIIYKLFGVHIGN